MSNYAQGGGFAKVSHMFSTGTQLSLGGAVVYGRNFENKVYVGTDSLVSTVDLGVMQVISKPLFVSADVSGVSVRQYSFNNTISYGNAKLKAGYKPSQKFEIGLSANSSFGNRDWQTFGGGGYLTYWLN